MRKFPAVNAGGSRAMLDALCEAGFVEVLPEDFDGEDRFFCIVTKTSGDNDRLWVKWRPKLVFAYEREGNNSHLYTWREIILNGDRIHIGALFDPLDIPDDWHVDYGARAGDMSLYAKVVADYSYRRILDELIEETAQWCGHMSSVVHRL
ncbi:MAG: hypothetical protein LBO03_08870 [Acidaminococcales bacterium]|jgi:hypothetical protein|nr:hypothetical protein [Acidaminococcales bacterium]